MFSVNPRLTLDHIIFTIMIQKSEIQWKVLRVCLENLPMGVPLGKQTFLWGCAPQESLITLGTSLGQIFPDNPLDFPLFIPGFSHLESSTGLVPVYSCLVPLAGGILTLLFQFVMTAAELQLSTNLTMSYLNTNTMTKMILF